MAGHSKWANIKHRKAAVDKKRGKLWTKLSRVIIIAAKSGGNPDDNPTLRLAVDKAKAANMPKDTIEKAIQKGAGELGGEDYEEVLYEGYGPNGVAIMCKCLTDNRNRTAPEIKKIFERSGGNLGTANSVAFMFTSTGLIYVERDKADEEKLMELVLEAGAEDFEATDEAYEISTSPGEFQAVKNAIDAEGIEIASADISMVAANEVTLELDTARKIMNLIDTLEDHDDVDSVYSNSDIPDDIMSQIA